MSQVVPVATLHALLRLDPETGRLYWRERGPEWFTATNRRSAMNIMAVWNSRYANKEALTCASKGYRQGRILGEQLQAHRVVFAMIHGYWPSGCVDHINMDPLDNRPENLRAATSGQNNANGPSRAGTSAFKGVSWNAAVGRWCANIQRRHIGVFATESAAAEAYDAAAVAAFGEFARTNRMLGLLGGEEVA